MTFIAARNVGALAQVAAAASARSVTPARGKPFDYEAPGLTGDVQIVLGIDPGVNGGLVGLRADTGDLALAWTMPTRTIAGAKGRMKRRLCGDALMGMLRTAQPIAVFIEDPGVVMGGKGLKATTSPLSVASLHHCFGGIEACVDAIGVEARRVHATTWKRVYGLIGKGRGKEVSMNAAAQLWPELGSLRKRDDGIAEAALIARYGLTHTAWKR